jgi:tetratricopeptide (TPR) repeat protein
MTTSAEEGRQLLTSAAAVLEELGDADEFSVSQTFLGDIAFRQDDLETAMEHYQRGIAVVGDNIGHRPEFKRRMASVLRLQGKIDEAAVLAEEAVDETAKDDWATVASTAMVLGQVREAQGRLSEAEELLRRAVGIVAETEYPGTEEYFALAELLVHTSRAEEARQWIAKARESGRDYPAGSPISVRIERRAAAIEAEAAAD